jgi:hypothetical protein
MIVTLVLIVIILLSFSVVIIGQYQALNNLAIEILSIEIDNDSVGNRVFITLRLSNPTQYDTPPFTMDVFIRPIVFSSDRFIAESNITEIMIDAASSTIQTCIVNLEPELVEVTLKGVTMKTRLTYKLVFNIFSFSKTDMHYYQSGEKEK